MSRLMVGAAAIVFGQDPNLAINAASHALYNNFAGCDLYAEMEEQRETAGQVLIAVEEAAVETAQDIIDNPGKYAEGAATTLVPFADIGQRVYRGDEVSVSEIVLETGLTVFPVGKAAKALKIIGKGGVKAASKFSAILASKLQKIGRGDGSQIKAFFKDEFGGGTLKNKAFSIRNQNSAVNKNIDSSSIFYKELDKSDLNVKTGIVHEIKGNIQIQNEIMNVRIDNLHLEGTNPRTIMENLVQDAQNMGIKTIKIEASFANDDLLKFFQKRYEVYTQGANETIIINIK